MMGAKGQSMHKPFLKWAGNKYAILQNIEAILKKYPDRKRLMEPFVGSGAVFLNTTYPESLLTDTNGDLIQLYQILQAQGEAFIQYCETFFIPQNNVADQYYQLREAFNTTEDPVYKSALFLYLNRHCFNGLCRYNAKHQFNVPFGRYQKPYFPQKEMLWFYQKSQRACFQKADFKTIMPMAKVGDIVYCDPPYVPLSTTANFTSYSAGGFSLEQQEALAKLAQGLADRDVVVLLSNHNTEFTQQIYHNAKKTELFVQRYISCQGKNRNKASELLALFEPASSVYR